MELTVHHACTVTIPHRGQHCDSVVQTCAWLNITGSKNPQTAQYSPSWLHLLTIYSYNYIL